jgi:hypothetical protein
MQMKLVKENINFERGKDPKESMNVGIMKSLEDKGIRFWFGWGDGEGEIEKQKLIKNISGMNNLINKLIEVGVDPKKMSISHHDTVEIKVVQILNGNRVIHQCATKEDAEMLRKACQAFDADNDWEERWSFDEGEKMIYVSRKNTWLDNLFENRKKYSAIS